MGKALFFSLIMVAGISQAQVITNQHLYDTLTRMSKHHAQRVALFEKEPIVTGKVIFLGNSITEAGAWNKLTGDSTVINRGVSGDITFSVLNRLGDIIKRKPSKLFILIGINDIGADIPDEVIADNCRKIIQRVKAGSPTTKVFLQSILPLNPDYPRFPQHYAKEDHVLRTNVLLRQVAATTQSTYVNLYPVFLDNLQHLDKKFTLDGLHLNEKAYELWVSFLKELGHL